MKKKVLLLPLILLVIMAAVAGTTTSRRDDNAPFQGQEQRADENQYPIVDYPGTGHSDPEKDTKRKLRSKKYNKSEWVIESNSAADTTTRFDYVDTKVPALPAARSKIVVIGEVIDARAYLSEDKSGVYSEFNLRIVDALKNDSDEALSAGCLIDAEREGGRVRFTSGRIHRYLIAEQDMPRVGRRYLLFLTRENQEQAFQIVTGYELRAGKVFPLDKLPQFMAYKGGDEAVLLRDTQDAITNSLHSPPK